MSTFLNPFALFGLVAAAIPLLLHIFNLRKLKTIEFSTLSFLKELQKSKIRRLKLRQLLLLFLRMLLIALVVIAFSRPTMKGSISGSVAGQAKTTAVILIDDSQSMTAVDEQGELLHQAKNAAAAAVNLLKEGDEVYLVRLSDVLPAAPKDLPAAQHNFALVRSLINDIKPSFLHRSIEDGLHLAARLMASSKNFNKEVYLVSDVQSGSLESKLPPSHNAGNVFPPSTQVFIIPLGTREMQNVSVESITIPQTIFEVGKPFTVRIRLVNHGASAIRNHVVSIIQDGIRAAQKGVDIGANRTAEMDFTLTPKHSGFLDGNVELEDDDLEFDNQRSFTVHIPEQLRTLLVGLPPDIAYLRLALAARALDSSAGLTVSETNWAHFSSPLLKNVDALVLSNPPALTPDQMTAVRTYLEDGGGVLYFPGDQTELNTYNNQFAGTLGISSMVSLDRRSARPQDASGFLEFDKVDLRHPLFEGMFEGSAPGQASRADGPKRVLESPRVETSVQFVPTARSKTIVSLTNGYPFLIDESVKNGRVIVVSVSATPAWSDFPLKGIFVPLVHRALEYLAQDPSPDRAVVAGDEATLRLAPPIPPVLTVVKPGGIAAPWTTHQTTPSDIFRFTDTDLPGVYSVQEHTRVLDKFAVNVDPDESRTARADEKRRIAVFARCGIGAGNVHEVSAPQDVQRVVAESRLGSELWKQFLILALGIALIEMFVARESKRSASTQSPS